MNRKFTVTLILVVALLMIVGSILPTIGEARDHRHWRYHPYYGWGYNPYVAPWYPYPPVYVPPLYMPQVIVPQFVVPQPQQQIIIREAPQTYVEQPKPQEQAENYWKYCPDTKTYFPYVQTCASTWLKVIPQTAPPQ